jgi:hypothetical protein
VLTESVRYAVGVDGPVPSWLNRVLDTAIGNAEHLREASRRGWIDPTWSGLAELAARPGTTAALTKARTLVGALDVG